MNDALQQNRDLASTLGQQACAARVALGMTQAQAAEKLDITVKFCARMERGRALPSIPILRRMSLVLETPADKLLGLSEPGDVN